MDIFEKTVAKRKSILQAYYTLMVVHCLALRW